MTTLFQLPCNAMNLLPSNKTCKNGFRKSHCAGAQRKIFENKKEEVTGDWRKSHDEELRYFVLLSKYSHYRIKDSEVGRGMWHMWGKREMHADFDGEKLMERTTYKTQA